MSNSTSIHEPPFKLQIPNFPLDVARRLEEIANSSKPRTTRNPLVEWVLTEFAAGRMVHVDTLKGKEMAA